MSAWSGNSSHEMVDANISRNPFFVEDQEKRLLMIEGLGKDEDSSLHNRVDHWI